MRVVGVLGVRYLVGHIVIGAKGRTKAVLPRKVSNLGGVLCRPPPTPIPHPLHPIPSHPPIPLKSVAKRFGDLLKEEPSANVGASLRERDFYFYRVLVFPWRRCQDLRSSVKRRGGKMMHCMASTQAAGGEVSSCCLPNAVVVVVCGVPSAFVT